jgi:hypothetical protein
MTLGWGASAAHGSSVDRTPAARGAELKSSLGAELAKASSRSHSTRLAVVPWPIATNADASVTKTPRGHTNS